MSKKDFIALANAIRQHNHNAKLTSASYAFDTRHLETLADFCRSQNSAFMRDRWLDYIAGKCGSNGGAIKT